MLAILTSHPIQYQAPLWRAIAADARVPFEVWFLTPHAVKPSYDREFGKTFAWDVDLLSGFPHRFLDVAPDWRLDRFFGIRVRESWRQLLVDRNVSALWVEGWRFSEQWAAVAAAHRLGIPVWLRGETHGLAPEGVFKRLLRRAALGWFFRRTSGFLCIGSANRRFYRRLGVPESALVPAPYCVDNRRFAEEASRLLPERAAIRNAWGIAPDAKCVLFCGKLIPKKRPLDLFAAAARVSSVDGAPVHLLWAGDGLLGSELRTAHASAGAPPVTFAGFLNQSNVSRAYAAADVLVLPSDFGETWGLVANEAMASGVPVIASDRCGCAEDLAQPLGPRHVFPCGDREQLAVCIEDVLRTPPEPRLVQEIIARHDPARTVETVRALHPSR